MPLQQRIALGELALLVDTCPHRRGATAVRAQLEGGQWTWAGDYVYEAASFENELYHYTFELGAALPDGGHVLVQHYVACDYDGCDRTRFYAVKPAGAVELIADETLSEAWGVGDDGAFWYSDRTGYSIGYHVASATWTYRWDGAGFQRQPGPVLKAEYANWPCPDGVVQPVDAVTGLDVGDPIPVTRGAAIEVLATHPEGTAPVFEYRVGEDQFWAENWTQTCAG